MKKNFTSIISLGLLVTMSSLTSCQSSGRQIGILQLATHPDLDKVTEGFKAVLNEHSISYTINMSNPEGKESLIPSMASNLVLKNELVLGIATSASQGLKKAADDKGLSIPILFSAVTDPVGAGLVDNITNPGKNVSGCSDMGPVKESIDLLDYFSGIDTVAGLYNISESNSQYQIGLAKNEVNEKGWTFVDASINSDTLIESKINSLSDSVDAIYIPTDNMIAKAISNVAKAAKARHLVVICGSESMVEVGGIAALGVDYLSLGRSTGELAVKILNGEAKVGDLAVAYASKFPLTVNKKLADEWGVTLSDELIAEAQKEGNNLIQ